METNREEVTEASPWKRFSIIWPPQPTWVLVLISVFWLVPSCRMMLRVSNWFLEQWVCWTQLVSRTSLGKVSDTLLNRCHEGGSEGKSGSNLQSLYLADSGVFIYSPILFCSSSFMFLNRSRWSESSVPRTTASSNRSKNRAGKALNIVHVILFQIWWVC